MSKYEFRMYNVYIMMKSQMDVAITSCEFHNYDKVENRNDHILYLIL